MGPAREGVQHGPERRPLDLRGVAKVYHRVDRSARFPLVAPDDADGVDGEQLALGRDALQELAVGQELDRLHSEQRQHRAELSLPLHHLQEVLRAAEDGRPLGDAARHRDPEEERARLERVGAQISAVGAPAHVTASSVWAFAVFTLMRPWPQTVMTRFLGFVGSGSMNVAQKSSVTPLMRWSSSRESYGAFLRRYGFGKSE